MKKQTKQKVRVPYEEIVDKLKVYWDDQVFTLGRFNFKETEHLIHVLAGMMTHLTNVAEIVDRDETPAQKVKVIEGLYRDCVDPEFQFVSKKLDEFMKPRERLAVAKA